MYRYLICLLLFLGGCLSANAQFYKPIAEWFDYSFNQYDSTYIKRENRQVSVKLKVNDMIDSYTFRLHKKYELEMESELSSEIALNVGYGVLSLGYSKGIQNLLTNDNSTTRNFL